MVRGVVAVDVYEDVIASGARRLASFGDVIAAVDDVRVDGTEVAAFTFPRDSEAWGYIREGRVLVPVWGDVGWRTVEWRIAHEIETDGADGRRVGVVECESPRYDLVDRAGIALRQDGLVSRLSFNRDEMPVSDAVDFVLGLPGVPDWFERGTVDAGSSVWITSASDTPLALLNRIAADAELELHVERQASGKYAVHLVTKRGANAEKPQFAAPFNLRSLARSVATRDQITRAYPSAGEGLLQGGLGDAAWTVQAVAGRVLTMADADVIAFDDQLTGPNMLLSDCEREHEAAAAYDGFPLALTDLGMAVGDKVSFGGEGQSGAVFRVRFLTAADAVVGTFDTETLAGSSWRRTAREGVTIPATATKIEVRRHGAGKWRRAFFAKGAEALVPAAAVNTTKRISRGVAYLPEFGRDNFGNFRTMRFSPSGELFATRGANGDLLRLSVDNPGGATLAAGAGVVATYAQVGARWIALGPHEVYEFDETLLDPTDIAAPYPWVTTLGPYPNGFEPTVTARSGAAYGDGKLLFAAINGSNSTEELWRLNPDNFSDKSGVFGLVVSLPFTPTGLAYCAGRWFGISHPGDVWDLTDTANIVNLGRIPIADPISGGTGWFSLEGSPAGELYAIFSRASGGNTNDELWRLNPDDITDTAGRFGPVVSTVEILSTKAATNQIVVREPVGTAGGTVQFSDENGEFIPYLEEPGAVGRYGPVSGVIRRPEMPGVGNLLTNGDMSGFTGGNIDGWTVLNGATVSRYEGRHHDYGPYSARIVTDASGEGVRQVLNFVVPSDNPYLIAVAFVVLNGTGFPGASLEFGGVTAQTYSVGSPRMLVAYPRTRRTSGNQTVSVVQSGAGRGSMVVQGVMLLNATSLPDGFIAGRVGNRLWRIAQNVLRERSQAVERLDVGIIDRHRMDPVNVPYGDVRVGVDARITSPDRDVVRRVMARKRNYVNPGDSQVVLAEARISDVADVVMAERRARHPVPVRPPTVEIS